MSVSAVIVTRGDVDLSPIIGSMPPDVIDEVIVWDNSQREDLAVYGRYAAIAEAKGDLIFCQDDDCVVSDPQAIVRAYIEQCPVVAVPEYDDACWWNGVVCNMPANFRHAFYSEHALVGFGACFHRDAPQRAFYKFGEAGHSNRPFVPVEFFNRTCDIVFTALTPRVLVDIPYDDLPWASADNRMWKQPTHREERQKMLDLVLKVRDS